MRPMVSLVILGFLGASSAHAASKSMAQVLTNATQAMKTAGYRSNAQRNALQLQRQRQVRSAGVQNDLLHLINDSSFLEAFEKHGGSMVLSESPKGEKLYLEASPGASPGYRVGLYASSERKRELVGEVPKWVKENIDRFPNLTSRALRTAVGEWTQDNFTKR